MMIIPKLSEVLVMITAVNRFNRVGCNVTGYDINPMAYRIVNREIEYLGRPTENRQKGLSSVWKRRSVLSILRIFLERAVLEVEPF